jgi:hypothetical protein
MIRVLTTCLALVLATLPALAEEKVPATLYKNPDCACCEKYADYLRSGGFAVTVIETRDMTPIKRKYGVSEELEGCHTTVIGDYVVEGHVPVMAIKRLLKEQPAIKGISLPGMPEGSPGMGGTKKGPFRILSITDKQGPAPVYAAE